MFGFLRVLQNTDDNGIDEMESMKEMQAPGSTIDTLGNLAVLFAIAMLF
jgi:hypothetical protein